MDFRFATAYQIALMLAANVTGVRERLESLWRSRYLDQLELPMFISEESPPAVYILARDGKRVLVAYAGLDPSAITIVSGRRNYLFLLHHTLKRNDFRATLYAACREKPGMRFLFWKQDKEVGDSILLRNPGRESLRIPLVPDGFFGLETPWGAMSAFVEIDRGTTGLKRFLLKQRGYFQWWSDQEHLSKYGFKNFRILTVTTTTKRLEHLRLATLRVKASQQGSGIFWFTTFDQISLDDPESIFRPIWRRAKAANGELHPLID